MACFFDPESRYQTSGAEVGGLLLQVARAAVNAGGMDMATPQDTNQLDRYLLKKVDELELSVHKLGSEPVSRHARDERLGSQGMLAHN